MIKIVKEHGKVIIFVGKVDQDQNYQRLELSEAQAGALAVQLMLELGLTAP